MVTLLGPGGVGKTRLAIAAATAASFPFGGAFVDLVPVAGQFVAQAVAAAMGVAESPQRSLTDAITERLGRGPSLLVLDNCEHLLDSVTEFADLVLTACSGVRVLVTSRERLRVPSERTIPVGPLPAADAEALFHDRAMAADPNYAGDADAVADVCARLDGLPLTIELAAARWASLGATGLLAGLADHLRLLSGGRGVDARHRSLRAVLEWSHGLLDPDEQRLLRSLSVFAGPFDLTGIAAVTGDEPAAVADLLGRLVDKSLVVAEPSTGRWRLLATVRAFARDRLRAAGADEDLRARHLAWAAATAATLAEQDFDLIADDLRAALWSCPPGRDRAAHTLARDLGRLTYLRRFLGEARKAICTPPSGRRPRVRPPSTCAARPNAPRSRTTRAGRSTCCSARRSTRARQATAGCRRSPRAGPWRWPAGIQPPSPPTSRTRTCADCWTQPPRWATRRTSTSPPGSPSPPAGPRAHRS
ncbi:hypothetical protein GCM10029964_067640 [Kibdelosporangium lantanae]